MLDEVAYQTKVQNCSEQMVYMWRIGGRKDCVLTRGDLTDMWKQSKKHGEKVYRKESAEAIVPISLWKLRFAVATAGEGLNFRLVVIWRLLLAYAT